MPPGLIRLITLWPSAPNAVRREIALFAEIFGEKRVAD